jgi:hypothetical protein
LGKNGIEKDSLRKTVTKGQGWVWGKIGKKMHDRSTNP